MRKPKVVDSSNIEDKINEQLPIHRKWRAEIVRVVKEQVSQIEEPEDWQDLLNSWDWFKKPNDWVIHTFNLFINTPAATPYFLALGYLNKEEIDYAEVDKKKMKTLTGAFRRAIHSLYSAGLIRGIAITPEEVGYARNSVTMWVTPWAKEKDIEKIRHFYTELVEGRPGIAQKKKKKPKDISEHNRQVKVYSILDKYRKQANVCDFYKCPKKHSEGLKSFRKIHSPYKRKITVRTCIECKRQLIQISYGEFMELKKKELAKQWDIKII